MTDPDALECAAHGWENGDFTAIFEGGELHFYQGTTLAFAFTFEELGRPPFRTETADDYVNDVLDSYS